MQEASVAAEIAKNAGAAAAAGGKIVEETIVGMNRISEVVYQAAHTVEALGQSSDQIGEIVQMNDAYFPSICDNTLPLSILFAHASISEAGP